MAKKKSLGEPEVNGHAVAEAPIPEQPPVPPAEKTQPVHTIRARNVRAAIWANSRPDGSTWYAVTFSRSYKDEGGNWHSTDSFGGADLLILAEVSRQAFTWIVQTTQGDTPF